MQTKNLARQLNRNFDMGWLAVPAIGTGEYAIDSAKSTNEKILLTTIISKL